jgi:predicted metallopeptidase
MEHRKINENYRQIAEELIRNTPELNYIKNSCVRITYLESDSTKKNGTEKLVFGECEKVASKNQWAINADFTITVYANNVIGMSEEQIKILLFHELLHIGIDYGTDGGEVYSVKKHDLEDFKIIIDKYGTDWATVAQ